MSITQTPTGWTFDLGRETFGPYATREAAATARYDAERGRLAVVLDFLIARDADDNPAIGAWIDQHLPAEDAPAMRTGAELPFGTLADGTPITGVYDKDEPGGRSGIVHAEVGSFWLSAQDEPNLFTLQSDELQLCDMTIEQINTLRALLATDVPEQLLAAAVAHSRGDAEPPTHQAIAPAVRLEQWRGEDGPVYNDLVTGDGLTKVLIGTYGGTKPGVELIIGGNHLNIRSADVITLADVSQLRDNLTAILSDARLADVLDPIAA